MVLCCTNCPTSPPKNICIQTMHLNVFFYIFIWMYVCALPSLSLSLFRTHLLPWVFHTDGIFIDPMAQ